VKEVPQSGTSSAISLEDNRYLYIALCFCFTVFLIGTLPFLAHSQEEVLTTGETEEVSDVNIENTSNTSLLGLYPSEGVPGGGGAIGDFVVGPGKVDLSIEPGQTKIVEMNVTNRTGETRRFNIKVEDAAGGSNTETPIVLLGDDAGPYSLRDYITVPHDSFDLEHNQRARIPVTISLPSNAEPAGLYGSVLVDTVAIKAKPGDSGGTVPQSAIIARVGTLFFITVPGEVEKAAELKQFSTVPEQTFYQSSPINFGILYENTGSIHVSPYGEMRIENMFGEEVGHVELDPWFVLPDSVRLREVSWNREALFGRYTATVYLNRSYNDIIDEASYSFWVLPWKPLALGFAVIFLVIFGIRAFFRRFEFKQKS